MKHFLFLLVSIITRSQFCYALYACESLVYCKGDLLDTVQRAKIYKDSKTFVDMRQINTYKKTLKNFETLKENAKNNLTKEQITEFVKANFVLQGELDFWAPIDYQRNPKFLRRIGDSFVRKFAKMLIKTWPALARKVKQDVVKNQHKYSLIYVPNGFIVPGGRFREQYYWDTYWVVRGLLLCEMRETVRGMLENFIFLVKQFGFVPNGNRVYYVNRSQPPLLIMMVGLYIDETYNLEWLRQNIVNLEKELYWWLSRRTVDVKKNGVLYKMAHYSVDIANPRPESYEEDITTCSIFRHTEGKEQCYRELRSAAESGWDFSSRWIFDSKGDTNTNLTGVQTSRVLPVDLNAILCKSFEELSRFYLLLQKRSKSDEWRRKADQWKEAIEAVFYDKRDGIWYDYDLKLAQPRKMFFLSNFAPLWTQSYHYSNTKNYGDKAAKYLKNHSVEKYTGGLPTSLIVTGEQWDLPNAWPPLQEIVISGLQRSGDKEAMQLAELFGKRWVEANMMGYRESGDMFEKYDAVNFGKYGGGGEYVVQTGFGWSNGVVLQLINEYYATKTSDRRSFDQTSSGMRTIRIHVFWTTVWMIYSILNDYIIKIL